MQTKSPTKSERGKVRLTWARALAPIEGSVGSAVYGYEVLRAVNDGPLQRHATVRAATPNFLDDQVLGGERYQYAVRSYDLRGERGPTSDPLSVSVPQCAERFDAPG